MKELSFIFSSHPLAACGRAGQLRVSLYVSRPRADWGRKLNQIKGNERRRGVSRGNSTEWIFSRCGDWCRIKGRGRACRIEIIHWPTRAKLARTRRCVIDCTLLCGRRSFSGKMQRMAARLEIVLRLLFARVYGDSLRWNAFQLPNNPPPTPFQCMAWVVGNLLSTAHPHVAASLISRATDSLIERSQFMNIS